MNFRKKLGLIISLLCMIAVIVMIGPLDIFTHGFFCDEIDYEQIPEEDVLGHVNPEKEPYEMVFSPQKRHMVGFEVLLANQPEDNYGKLILTIINGKGIELDRIIVDLSEVSPSVWYKVRTTAKLKEGEKYTLRFTAEDCKEILYLPMTDSFYLPDETISGNVLCGYAYADSTFTFQNKILIVLFILAVWGFLYAFYINERKKRYVHIVSAFVFMVAVLAWNYMYNSMDNANNGFQAFQADSETLVTSMIYAEQDGITFRNEMERGYGLGRYNNLKGKLNNYNLSYLTDDNWLDGYSRTEAAVVVDSNSYSKEVAVVGNYFSFSNGETFQIISVKDNGEYINIYFDTDEILSSIRNGSLDDVILYDDNNKKIDKSLITAYKSQYGFQGKVFRHLARYMDRKEIISNLYLLCSLAAATIFTLISLLIAAKYNKVMAGVFFFTFWLSPWIVNFARNLYWVEFTWFIPMAVGLFCAWKIENRKCRVISYIAAFISIFGKCLCGYEYITVVMMGMISFLLADLVIAFTKMDKQRQGLLFRTIFILGVVAIAGFIAAICVHALLKGNGNILEGVRNIFENDVLRRTQGADMNKFGSEYWASFNASVWETFCKYFHFRTEVIAGIAGNLFPALCVIPLCIFGYEYKVKRLNIELLAMYVIFFLTTVSWFCLAKGHSYIHLGMNYVLWYFGFVQICVYVPVKKVIDAYKVISVRITEEG